MKKFIAESYLEFLAEKNDNFILSNLLNIFRSAGFKVILDTGSRLHVDKKRSSTNVKFTISKNGKEKYIHLEVVLDTLYWHDYDKNETIKLGRLSNEEELIKNIKKTFE